MPSFARRATIPDRYAPVRSRDRNVIDCGSGGSQSNRGSTVMPDGGRPNTHGHAATNHPPIFGSQVTQVVVRRGR